MNQSRHTYPAKQRGSILVNATAGIFGLVILMSVADLGYVFYLKREYQKTADLAALAGAHEIRNNPAGVVAVATQNAQSNLGGRTPNVSVSCGSWDPTLNPMFATTACASADAVRVTISGVNNSLLPYLGERTIGAVATASQGDPLAAFSVGTRTARVDGGVLGTILAVPGLNLNGSTLLAYDGLANVNITPGGLLEALGIPVAAGISAGDFNALLAAENVSLGDLLNATAVVAGQNQLLTANTALVNAIKTATGLSSLTVKLGSESGAGGLFAEVIAPDGQLGSALSAGVNALGIVNTAIAVATAQHAVSIPSLNLNLLGLVSVTTRAAVVEPPSIAIGGLGPDGICSAGEDCPTAYTAQVRTHIHVQTTDALLGALLKNLIKLDLPIVLDVSTAQGELGRLCTADLKSGGEDRGRIDVDAALLKACVGKVNEADLFSKSKACDENLQTMELLNVAGLLKLPNNKLNLSGLTDSDQSILAEGDKETLGNSLAVGTLVSDIVNQLTSLLFGGAVPSGASTNQQNVDTATQLFNDTSSLCSVNTYACNATRLAAVKTRIETAAAQSGLLSGLLNGIGDLLGSVLGLLGGDGCSYRGLLGPATPPAGGCVTLIKNTLAKTSSSSSGGSVSNTLGVLTGILKPVLNALGSTVLTPLFNNVLGLHVGETDVEMLNVDCGGNPKLVE
jgi:uncharacterized membrane protein